MVATSRNNPAVSRAFSVPIVGAVFSLVFGIAVVPGCADPGGTSAPLDGAAAPKNPGVGPVAEGHPDDDGSEISSHDGGRTEQRRALPAPEVKRPIPSESTVQRNPLEGRIVDLNGAPVGDVRGTLRTSGAVGTAAAPLAFRTDHTGRFALPAVANGRLLLRTTAPVQSELSGIRFAPGSAPVDMHIDCGPHHCTGSIVAEDGSPIAGARVHLERHFRTPTGADGRAFRACLAGERGEFAFVNIGGGAGTLTIMASGFATRVHPIEDTSGARPHEIRLQSVTAPK